MTGTIDLRSESQAEQSNSLDQARKEVSECNERFEVCLQMLSSPILTVTDSPGGTRSAHIGER